MSPNCPAHEPARYLPPPSGAAIAMSDCILMMRPDLSVFGKRVIMKQLMRGSSGRGMFAADPTTCPCGKC